MPQAYPLDQCTNKADLFKLCRSEAQQNRLNNLNSLKTRSGSEIWTTGTTSRRQKQITAVGWPFSAIEPGGGGGGGGGNNGGDDKASTPLFSTPSYAGESERRTRTARRGWIIMMCSLLHIYALHSIVHCIQASALRRIR